MPHKRTARSRPQGRTSPRANAASGGSTTSSSSNTPSRSRHRPILPAPARPPPTPVASASIASGRVVPIWSGTLDAAAAALHRVQHSHDWAACPVCTGWAYERYRQRAAADDVLQVPAEPLLFQPLPRPQSRSAAPAPRFELDGDDNMGEAFDFLDARGDRCNLPCPDCVGCARAAEWLQRTPLGSEMGWDAAPPVVVRSSFEDDSSDDEDRAGLERQAFARALDGCRCRPETLQWQPPTSK